MSDPTLYQSEARAQQRDPRAQTRDQPPRQASPPTDAPRLHRRRRTADPFYIDPRLIPPGFSYEWKRESIFGQPDGEHQIGLRENHWRAVPAARHPELASAGDTVIRRGGSLLMERPKYLTDEARLEDIHEAMKPVLQKEELLYGPRPNELPRAQRPGFGVNQQYAPGEPILEDGKYSEP